MLGIRSESKLSSRFPHHTPARPTKTTTNSESVEQSNMCHNFKHRIGRLIASPSPSQRQLVEMRRNPQGQVDKRVRATLRPMSKHSRDSSVSELEQRLRDVKSNNCRFRKTLMEKESELQALIRKIGADSLKWLGDGGLGGCEADPLMGGGGGGGSGGGGSAHKQLSMGGGKLSVPLSRHELVSTTEVTELTSVGSFTSTHADHSENGGTIVTDSRW